MVHRGEVHFLKSYLALPIQYVGGETREQAYPSLREIGPLSP